MNARGTIRIDIIRENSPAKLHRQLHGDLDNIILKALRKEPERRYTSAEQLSTDIRRHLQGLAVTATPDSISYRLRKFVKRHQAGVMAITLVLFAVIGGVITTLREAYIAKQNQLRAERRFNDVRKLANSLLFEIHDSIQNLPGSIPARKLLVERALEYLDSLARESNGDASLQHELAAAYQRVGDVQGYPFLANLGDTQGALQSYRRALEINEVLVKQNPQSIMEALQQASIYRRLAETDSMNQNLAGALAEGKKAVEIGERLAAQSQPDKNILKGLLQDYQTLAGIEGGNQSANLGDTAGALAMHRKVVEIADKLCADGHADAAMRRMFAGAVLRLGDQLTMSGSWQSAEKQYQKGLSILLQLVAPNDATSQADLAEALSRVGNSQIAASNFIAARQTFDKVMEIEKALYKTSPTDISVRIGLFSAYINIGDVASKSGETKQSMAALRTAREMGEQIASISPIAEVRYTQGLAYIVSGEALARAGDNDGALHEYHAALSTYDHLHKEDPNNVDTILCLAATYNKIGTVRLNKHQFRQAEESFRQALELAQTSANDSNAQKLYVIADSNTGLGTLMFLEASGQNQSQTVQIEGWHRAQSYYEESLKTWQKIHEPGIESPDGFDCIPPTVVRQQLSHCQKALEQFSAKQNNHSGAGIDGQPA